MTLERKKHELFMREALKEAKKAYEEDEIPVGAVIVRNNKVIARGYNQMETLHDATAHAEMIAITSAQNSLGSKYLNDCELYVTLEPCMMCSGAIFLSKVKKVVYSLQDKERGHIYKSKESINKKLVIIDNILENDSKVLINSFFEKIRK